VALCFHPGADSGSPVWKKLAAAEPPAAGTAAAEADPETRVAQLLRSARRKREAGQTAEALADLRNASTVIKQAKGAGHRDSLPVLDLAGAILVETGQYGEAQSPLEKAVSLREGLVAEGQQVQPVDAATTLVLLAKAQAATGGFDKAQESFTKAVAIIDGGVEPSQESTAAALAGAALEQLADVRFATGDTAAAAAALGQLYERRLTRGGAAAPDVLATALLRAQGQVWSGEGVNAVEPLADALKAYERARGDRKLLPRALRQLADLQVENADLDAARQSLLQARDIDRATFGEGQPAVILDSLKLLRIDMLQGGVELALKAGEPLLAAAQKLCAREDPLSAALARAAAEVRLTAQDFVKAADLYRKALEIDSRSPGGEQLDAAMDEAGLGRCLLDGGDPAAARRHLENALGVVRRIRGPAHAETLDLVAAVGGAAARSADTKTADACLQTLIEHGAPRWSGAAEGALCGLADAVATLKEKAGDAAGAKAARNALIALRQGQFGEQHERVAEIIVRLADARRDAGAHADAVALYEQAVAMTAAQRSADHPDVAVILAPLAASYRAMGATDKAADALIRCLAIWEAAVGPNHPMTNEIVKRLALVRLAQRNEEAALPLMTRLLAAYDADPATPLPDRIKLLKKMAQIHEARGDTAITRGLLGKLAESEAALAKIAKSMAPPPEEEE